MNIIKKTSAVALLLGGVLMLAGTEVQAVDFNISTQLTDLRSDGSNNNPGFNPCRGGTRSTAGVCGGAAANQPGVLDGTANALLDVDNLQTKFPSLGPGAVTDNMFGRVSGADLGADGIAGNADDIGVTACGKTTSGATLAGLNCGDLRFDPASQGQTTLTTAANTLITPAGGLNMNTQFVADFCPGPGPAVTDCSDGAATPAQKVAAHTGFNLENKFNFQVVTPCTSPGVPAGCGTTGTSSGTDNVRQVTAVKTTGIGTQAAEGTGDQVVVVNARWTTAAGGSSNNPATGPTGLTIEWTQNISDPDQSGTGSGSFVQNIAGTFTYNAAGVVSAQYPSGKTQTERSTGVAAPAGETLDFGP